MKKSLLLAAGLLATASAFAAPEALYVIGDDVNGNSWLLLDETAILADKGNGIYEGTIAKLGTGFKINDGTWSDPNWNLGAPAGVDLSLDVPFAYWADGMSGNIAFNGFTEVNNATVTVNTNDGTITVTGEASGKASWYLAGVNGDFEFATMPLFEETEAGVYEIAAVTFNEGETISGIKVTDTGWSHQLGTNDPENVFFDAENLFQTLEDVSGEGGNIECALVGTYKVIFDYNEYTLEFVPAGDAVEAIIADQNAAAVYYNLQGARVANPENGIFVKVAGGKAVKVVK